MSKCEFKKNPHLSACVIIIMCYFKILNILDPKYWWMVWYEIDSTNLGQRIDNKGPGSSMSEAQGWTGQRAAHEKNRMTP